MLTSDTSGRKEKVETLLVKIEMFSSRTYEKVEDNKVDLGTTWSLSKYY